MGERVGAVGSDGEEACRLGQAGVPCRVFETRDRIGGRCWSARDWAAGQVGEHGGEFIDDETDDRLHDFMQKWDKRRGQLADTLDSCITEDMTFAKHFFNELATLPHDDESHWMNLLEDLALIFRAKRLAFPELPEEGEERRLLEFFETSEEWDDPQTEVGSWYWKLLPERLSR